MSYTVKTIVFLASLMMLTASTIIGVALYTWYHSSIESESARLSQLVTTRSRIIETIARHEQLETRDLDLQKITERTLIKFREAHSSFSEFGETGEFTIAYRVGDKIRYLMRHVNTIADNPDDVQWGTPYAEPMHQAIKARTGTMIGHDYRGVEVLAAYTPINILNLGLVAKIDMAEIQKPFIAHAVQFLLVSVFIIIVGSFAFLHITNPLILKIESDNELMEPIVHNANDIIFSRDLNSKYTFINQAGYAFIRDDVNDVIGRTPQDLFSVGVADVIMAHDERAIKTKKPVQYSYDFDVRGSVQVFQTKLTPILDDNEQVSGLIGISRNITQDIERDRKLIAANKRTALIADNTLDGIILLNEKGKIVFWNPAAARIFGYSFEEVYGRDPHDILTPADEVATARNAMSHFLETGEGDLVNRTIELKANHKDGREIDVELSLSSMRQDGKWLALGLARDISIKKDAENKLKEAFTQRDVSSKKFKYLFNKAQIGLMDENFYDLYQELERLRGLGIRDIKDYLLKNMDVAAQLSTMVTINDVNGEVLNIFNAKDKEHFYNSISETFVEDSVQVFIDEVAAIWNKEPTFYAVAEQKTIDGRLITVQIDIPIPEHEENFKSIPVSIKDVSTKVLDENRNQAIREISELIHDSTETEILQFGLAWVEKLTNSHISFLHFVNDDQETIELVTWSKRTLETYCHVDELETHYPIREAGVWADAFRRRTHIIINDYESYPRKKGLPEGHAYLKRLISFPIVEGDKVRVLLGAGNKATDYSDEDVTSIEILTDYLWRVISRKRIERDVRKKTQEVLNNTRKYKELFDNAQISLWDVDYSDIYLELKRLRTQGVSDLNEYLRKNPDDVDRFLSCVHINNVNENTVELFGFDDVDHALRDFHLIFKDNSKDAFIKTLTCLWEGKSKVEARTQYQNMMGDPIEAILSAPLPNDFDVLKNVPFSVMDITIQVRALQELDEETAARVELENIMNQSPSVAFCWRNDENWTVEYVSENVSEWGYSKQQLESGKIKFAEIIEPSDLERVGREVADHVVNNMNAFSQMYRIVRPDGSVRWIDDRTWVRRNGNGEITHFQGVCTDVTEQKEVERQLWQAQKSESLGNMAGGIAHDFNNMLLPILALADLTKTQAEPDSPIEKRMGKIIDAGQKAQDLVARLMKFSRTEEVTFENLDIVDLMHQTHDLLKQTIPSSVEIIVKIPEEEILVHGNSAQLQSVFINLAKNSADSLNGRNGRLYINLKVFFDRQVKQKKFEGLDRNERYVQLSFKDNGEGMEEKTLRRIFDPFFTTKPVGEGTGMGLAMVHGIVTAHKGVIIANSKYGKGSTFEIYLPICRG
ncbi:PAS domain S-box protein [Terasakiella sp. A23]|uniref:PAS domain S-box protein n=1 Tax=Terasakiella sp. FCG-A23 TaxID=3080561 RepID=UPI002952C58F|nr:PAS domain S-box protein [Terasakiella sp. A23]MDV7339612.1 PAS domain S-box protein [Terasakiella sp. A23]